MALGLLHINNTNVRAVVVTSNVSAIDTEVNAIISLCGSLARSGFGVSSGPPTGDGPMRHLLRTWPHPAQNGGLPGLHQPWQQGSVRHIAWMGRLANRPSRTD